MYDGDEYSGFHESYYEHICPIIPEKDVVYTDILGNGCVVYFKRWWRDLFLLSSNNGRYIGFYNSSHAMRIERFRQFRKYPRRIHPLSKFISFWNCVIVFAVLVNKILFRFTSSILFNIHLSVYYFAVCLELIIIADIFINILTGYADKEIRKVIFDFKMGLIHYCSTKLFMHMMSAIPVHCLMFLRYGDEITCSLCKCNRFIATLKLLNTFSLYRVFETTAFWTWGRYPPTLHIIKFSRIAIVGLITMLQFYDIVDVLWMLTVLEDQKLDSSSFIALLMLARYGELENIPSYMVICYDISRIFKSFFLFSFGLKANSGFVLDRISSVVAYIIANVFYTWTLLECYSMISRKIYPKENHMNARVYLTNLLASRRLSDELKHKIDQYFDFKSTSLKIFQQQNGLYKSLPVGLKREITLSCYSKLIMKVHKLFVGCPVDIIDELAAMLRPEMYLPNDIIAEAWTPGLGLMIVDVGVLAVYTVDHKETGHLIDGDYFGELSLVTDKEVRMSYVVAVTPCSILILDKMIFRNFMRQYPEYFYDLKNRLFNRKSRLTVDSTLPGKLESRQQLEKSPLEASSVAEGDPSVEKPGSSSGD